MERQAGFERHAQKATNRQPEARKDWIQGILLGMAALENGDGAGLVLRFHQQIESARGCAAVEMMPPAQQRQLVGALCGYMDSLAMQCDDPRMLIMDVRNLLEDMTVHLSWDAGAIGIYPAREQAEHLLVSITAQRPIRFTRLLIGWETGPCESDFVSGVVTNAEDICGRSLYKRMCAQYPDITEWPAVCVVHCCGGKRLEDAVQDAGEFDLRIMREQGDSFLNRPGVYWGGVMRELRIPVQELEQKEMGGLV